MLVLFLHPKRLITRAASPPAVLPPVAINAMDVMHMGHIEIHIQL